MPVLLQINSVINAGSTGRIAEGIGRSALNVGWESYIAFGRNEQQSKSRKIKIGNKFDVYVHGINTRLFDRHCLCSAAATKKLIMHIKTIKPDIIHLHNIHGYFLNMPILFDFLAEFDAPVVWTLHDCWPFTGHCAYFDYVGCTQWRTGCFKCPQKNTYPASVLLSRAHKNYMYKKQSILSVKKLTLVPVSNWLAGLCAESFLKGIPLQVIHNGIDTEVFNAEYISNKKTVLSRYNIKTDFLILGAAFVWSKRKGLGDFIKLAAVLPKDAHIMLVGLSKKQIARLPPNRTGITRVNGAGEMAHLYTCADVYINPTWEDNFPTTNLEALSCGTPVITYNTGGSIESITPETGFIVAQGDIRGLAAALEKIKLKTKHSYSKLCRNHAVNFFTQKERFLEYINLYNNLID
ncbi:MAG: glycosyltransferase [Spirochaetaceae bacterium]|jgi:glycosyltransferase involved in cell wall biosynthesis|nr:glycosyltransferase [Spirochaetaceae bacterium]